jgi:hypothetical protein
MEKSHESRPYSLMEHQLKAIFSEYEMLRQEMRMFAEYHRRDTQIAFSLLGILIGLYFTQAAPIDQGLLAILITSTVFIHYLLQIINLHMVSAEAKACARIEGKVNKLLDFNAMDWESVVGKSSVRTLGFSSPAPIATGAILLFIMIIFAIFAFESAKYYGTLAIIAHITEFLIILFITISWLFFELRGQ